MTSLSHFRRVALVLAITLGGCTRTYMSDRAAWTVLEDVPKSERRLLRLVTVRDDGQRVLILPTSVEAAGAEPGDPPTRIRLRPRAARPLIIAGTVLMLASPIVFTLPGGIMVSDGQRKLAECNARPGFFNLCIGEALEVGFGAALIAISALMEITGAALTAAGTTARAREDKTALPPPPPEEIPIAPPPAVPPAEAPAP